MNTNMFNDVMLIFQFWREPLQQFTTAQPSHELTVIIHHQSPAVTIRKWTEATPDLLKIASVAQALEVLDKHVV